MTNHNNLQDLSNELENILETPVSIKILEKCTDGQRRLLTSLIYKWTQGEDVNATITSILDYGKSKLKPRVHSDKTNHYLKTKFN